MTGRVGRSPIAPPPITRPPRFRIYAYAYPADGAVRALELPFTARPDDPEQDRKQHLNLKDPVPGLCRTRRPTLRASWICEMPDTTVQKMIGAITRPSCDRCRHTFHSPIWMSRICPAPVRGCPLPHGQPKIMLVTESVASNVLPRQTAPAARLAKVTRYRSQRVMRATASCISSAERA